PVPVPMPVPTPAPATMLAPATARPGTSPDLDALGRGEIEHFARLHIKSGVPRVDVADRVSTIPRGGVGIFQHLRAQRVFTLFFAPTLAEGDEELLVPGEGILRGSGLGRERGAISIEGCGESGDIGDVFGQRLLAVDGKIGEGFVGIVLRREPGGRSVEM